MKPIKYVFEALYEHRDGDSTTEVAIVASDFTEAIKKAEDPATREIAQAGSEDHVELVSLVRGQRIDVE